MNPVITKVKNGTITLPQSASEQWSGADVEIFADADRVIIRRAGKPADGNRIKWMMDQFQKAARETGLTPDDVEDAIRNVRSEMKK